MLALAVLGVAVICALVSRVLLVMAGVKISVWWAVGVLFPFGPLFFRLSYPEEARRSIHFRYATVICFAAYLVMSPSPAIAYYKRKTFKPRRPHEEEPVGYALEKRAATPTPTPTLQQRSLANAEELERLKKVAEALRIRKRDLLHSDVEGNRQYALDLAAYNAALAKATADKNALATAK